MDESGRYIGIRIIEEIYVESTLENKTRTIFRGSEVEAANAEQLRKSKQTRVNAGKAKKKQAEVVQRKAAAKHRKIKKKSNPVRLIVITLIIVIAAGAATFGLNFAEGM